MGASSVVDPSKVIDPSIGALVWVRRRNGWWWPGQIISEDDLPEGCIQMPRSGTPVKLLGKEEAIVDWYNLEKSKRVKPFRCGEYTDCIEKAKSAASVSKKRVKYARREDAILEALDLERASLNKTLNPVVLDQETHEEEEEEEEQCNVEGKGPRSSLRSVKVREQRVEEKNIITKSDVDSVSGQELSQSGVSFEEPPNQIQTETKKSNNGNNNKTPNDSEDDGNEGAKKRMKGLEDLGMCVAAASSPSKRKSSQVSHAHELLKRKSKRRALTKVLESTTMVSSCQVEPVDSSVLNGSSSVPESCNGSEAINCSEITGASCEDAALLPENLDHESSQGLFDVPLVAEEKYTPHGMEDAHRTSHTKEKATSQWQLKGKRNSRSRKTEETEATNATAPSAGPSKDPGFKAKPVSQPDTEIQTEPVSQRLLPCRSSRFTPHPKYDSSDFSLGHRALNSGLCEVKVCVEAAASRAPQAPFISLMSMLYKQPITGYPIDVEVLEDGYCNNLITVSECYSSTCYYKGCKRMPPPRGLKPPPNTKKKKKMMKKAHKSKKKKIGEKMRKLSSLSGKVPLVEKMSAPLLACVPLKVVFSRINADLNSSIR